MSIIILDSFDRSILSLCKQLDSDVPVDDLRYGTIITYGFRKDNRMVETKKRVLSWDETFMAVAEVVAMRSKDPSTQVGAAIVSSDKRILSLGYNGTPTGFDDADFPWGKTSANPLDNKYVYVVHSERNAILNYRGSRRDLEGSTVYVTLFPCNECMKEIVQAGVKRVVYLNVPRDFDSNPIYVASKRIARECGIACDQYATNDDEITVKI